MSNRTFRLHALAAATALVFAAPVAIAGGPVERKGLLERTAALNTEANYFNSFIVGYKDVGANQKLKASQRNQVFKDAGARLGLIVNAKRRTAVGSMLIKTNRKLDKTAQKRLILELQSLDPNIAYVVPNGKLKPLFTPNDPRFAEQWHYAPGPGGVNAEAAWDLARGEGQVVAIVDTGIVEHADLAANVIPGYDMVSDPATSNDGDGRDADGSDPGDYNDFYASSWHGTHVAGTVAALTDNGVGVAGVAHASKVQPVRVLGAGGGTFADVADGIVWASGGSVAGIPDNATPADVINMSLGGGGACNPEMQAAIDTAIGNGSVVVVSAGNANADAANQQPASCAGVVTVGGTGPGGVYAPVSFGRVVEVAAPSGSGFLPFEDQVLSSINTGETTPVPGPDGDTYQWYFGTSMAAPHVSGTVALMQSVAPAPLTSEQVTEILVNTAYASNGFPTGAGCSNDADGKYCGSGVIDARYAVAVASGAEPLPEAPPPPVVIPAIPLENGVVVTDISVGDDESIVYELEVPNGASQLLFGMYGGTGDADLYVRFNDRPTDGEYDCRPFAFGNEESCYFPAPEAGTWFVRIKGFAAAEGVSLYPSFVDPGWARGLEAEGENLGNHRTRVQLQWTKGKRQVDVYRNGQVMRTIRNRGAYTDQFRIAGSGTMTYKICNTGTQECSNEASIDYPVED